MIRTITLILIALVLSGTAQAREVKKTRVTHNWWYLITGCESRGSSDPWYTNTGNGFYFGPQFTPGTWHAEGGGPVREMGDRNGLPMHSYSVQYIEHVAENTYRDQGAGAWPTCHRLGYI